MVAMATKIPPTVERSVRAGADLVIVGAVTAVFVVADMASFNAWKPGCSGSSSHPTKSAACLRRNSNGGLTLSINAGTSTPRSAASAASFLTHSELIEFFDQRTTTLRAVPIFGYGPAALGNSQSLHLASNRMSDYPRLQ
jgi:hypothetical protein